MKSATDGMLIPLSNLFGNFHALNVLSRVAQYEADFNDENLCVDNIVVFKSTAPETEQRLDLLRQQLQGKNFFQTQVASVVNKSKTTFDVVMQLSSI